MSSHTPGPWVVRKGDEWTRDVVTDHGEMPDGSRNYWNVASANIRRDECEANARLIAAAPDLFDAAKLVLAWYEAENDFTKEPDFYKRVEMCRVSEVALRAAIAKALGEKNE